MSLDSSMDKVLERRREVEGRLSDSANMSNSDLVQFSRELSDLRPVCEQIELVRRIEVELAGALVMVEEAGDDLDMLEMAQAEADLGHDLAVACVAKVDRRGDAIGVQVAPLGQSAGRGCHSRSAPQRAEHQPRPHGGEPAEARGSPVDTPPGLRGQV